MKSISVLGVQLKDLSVREALKLANVYLNSDSLSTVCFINTGLMLEARDSEEIRNCIESMDMVVPSTADVVSAMGYHEREIANNNYLREFLRKMSREKRRIFIVGSSEEEQVKIREALLSLDEKLIFFGCFSYTDQAGADDALINEINSVLPDVVISLIDSPMQELLVSRTRYMVNARVWLMLKEENLRGNTGKIKKVGKVRDFLDRILFKRIVNKYDSEQSEGSEKG